MICSTLLAASSENVNLPQLKCKMDFLYSSDDTLHSNCQIGQVEPNKPDQYFWVGNISNCIQSAQPYSARGMDNLWIKNMKSYISLLFQ